MSRPTAHPGRPSRGEPREIVELRRLKESQPQLGDAVDLQIALVELHRRVQSRIPLPWVQVDPTWLKSAQEAGRPLLRFEDIPLDWTDFRLMFREIAELLRRYDAIEELDFRTIHALSRDGNALKPLVVRWHNTTVARGADTRPDPDPEAKLLEIAGQVLLLAMRPFLMRCAEAVLPRLDLSGWMHGYCPLCGGEPELAEITPTADRLLICSRCLGRWRYHAFACPFCQNADRSRITSFASRDGLYRLFACDDCRRYIKAYDGRSGVRQVMVPLDTVATLPLDAAAIQKGYTG